MNDNNVIQGYSSVGRDLAVGGGATVQGSVTIGHDLRIKGILDAPNIKGPCKGLFSSSEELCGAYPHPTAGWYAYVGSSLPAEIWRAHDGVWADSGEEGGEEVVELASINQRISGLQTDLMTESTLRSGADNALQTKIGTLETSVDALDAGKADKSEVATKADKSYVDQELMTESTIRSGAINGLQTQVTALGSTVGEHSATLNEHNALVGTVSVSDLDDLAKGANGRVMKVLNGSTQVGTVVTLLTQSGWRQQYLFTPCAADSNGVMGWSSYNGGESHIWHRYYNNGWSRWTEVAGAQALRRLAAVETQIEGLNTGTDTLEASIAAETTGRTAALAALKAELQGAIGTATSALNTRIDGVSAAYATADEETLQTARREMADITSAINAMDASYKAADSVLDAAKADKTALATKADKSYVDEGLAEKASTEQLTAAVASINDTKATKSELASAAAELDAAKADKSEVATKADKTALATKADKSYVDAQLATKTDKSYVDAQLATKADTTAVTTAITTAVAAETASRNQAEGDLRTSLAAETNARNQADAAQSTAIEANATKIAALETIAGEVTTAQMDNADLSGIGKYYRVTHNGAQVGAMVTVNEDSRVMDQWLFSPCEPNATGQMVYNAYAMGRYHLWHRSYAKHVVLTMPDGEVVQPGSWSKWTEVAGQGILNRMTSLETASTNYGELIAGFETRLDASELAVNANTEDIAANLQMITALQTLTTSLGQALSAVESTTASQGAAIEDLQTRTGSNETAISGQGAAIATNAQAISAAQGNISALGQRMNAAEAGISNNAEAITAAEARMASAEQAMAAMQGGKADSAHFQSMSEEDYEAITAKDPQTYYFIYED